MIYFFRYARIMIIACPITIFYVMTGKQATSKTIALEYLQKSCPGFFPNSVAIMSARPDDDIFKPENER